MAIDSKQNLTEEIMKKRAERTVICYNYSNRDYAAPEFGGTDLFAYWAKQPLIVKAQERKRMPFYLAMHIAIHLAQREIANTPEYRKKERTPQEIRVTNTMIEEYVKKCVFELTEGDAPQSISAAMEMINQLNEEVEKKPAKRMGRPPKKSEPVKEEEFVGLKT